jgi:hypothetical protein
LNLLFQVGRGFPFGVRVNAGSVFLQCNDENALLKVCRVPSQDHHEEEIATNAPNQDRPGDRNQVLKIE